MFPACNEDNPIVEAHALADIDVINVKKIIINVNKRVYSEKDSKRL